MRLRQQDLEWREAEGEILVLDRRRGRYFAVTASGAELWPRLADGASETALVEHLRARYGIEERRARQDVAEFLGWLGDNDLLAR